MKDLQLPTMTIAEVLERYYEHPIDAGEHNAYPVPIVPNLWQQVEVATRDGHLDLATWHSCDTVHCVAGWITTIAGLQGRDLEARIGPARAAELIHRASCPWTNQGPPPFYSGNYGIGDADDYRTHENVECAVNAAARQAIVTLAEMEQNYLEAMHG
jgi:hypothetical protein